MLRERQCKPSQLCILDKADETLRKRILESFMKREAGRNVGDPRLISTIGPVDKRDYSMFMYAFADHMKQFEWYAFGKTPEELAMRVAEVCTGAARGVYETDFSRMDGRVSEVARYLEDCMMSRIFAAEHHEVLGDLLRSQRNLKGVTRFGVRYDSGLARLSGSPETSVFNTLLNAFVAYCALRETPRPAGDGMHTVQEAWAGLGVYGGDDGLTADADQGVYSNTAKSVGQVLTCDMKERGEMGVKFLARQYGPDVWQGDSTSVCDYARTLSKFHLTVTMANSISEEEKLVDKAYALWLTDAESPVVGEYVSAVMEQRPGSHDFVNRANNWNARWIKEVQYPNAHAEWMEELFERQLGEFDQLRFRDWLETANTLDKLRYPPLCIPRKAPVTKSLAVVEDELVEPSLAEDVIATATPQCDDQGTTHNVPGGTPVPTAPKGDQSKVAKSVTKATKTAGTAKTSVKRTAGTIKAPVTKLFRARKAKEDRPSRAEKTAGAANEPTNGGPPATGKV